MEKEKFELGPIQKQWLADLRAYPDRQGSCKLLTADDVESFEQGKYKACCLGQLELCYGNIHKEQGIAVNIMDNVIGIKYRFNEIGTSIPRDHERLGLHDALGASKSRNPKEIGLYIKEKGIKMPDEDHSFSLSNMNDSYMTWPQIADLVEKFPEAYFNKSV